LRHSKAKHYIFFWPGRFSFEEGGAMRFGAAVGRRLAALSLAVALSGIPMGHGQTVRPAGTLTGRIFLADGVTPRGGVVVKAANLSTSQIFASIVTDRAGRYSFANLPSGRYQVAVQADEGLYVNQEPVPVIQGRKTLFSLALNPRSAQDQPPQEPPAPENPPSTEPPPANPPTEQPPVEPPKPEQTQPAEQKPEEKPKEKTPAEKEAAEKAGKKGSPGFWRSGWGVATALGGGALVLGLLADQITGNTSEVPPPPSPSSP
jgi:carboxypeptidase family protein